ncbi:MAG TPA: penicillin-binding protein 2 [Elusimicrobiales bacterium]|nr:penicillin-binding protein 2 [Elusimicrobiales bacterium]
MTAKTLKTRIAACAFLAGAPAFIIAGRLLWLQTVQHEALGRMAARSFSRTVSETGPRGRVFCQGGELLAESIVTWDVQLFKKDLEDPEAALAALTRTLKLPAEFRTKFKRAKNFVPVKKNLDRAAFEAVSALKIKGVSLEPHQSRYYPSGDLARAIIGLVGSDKGLTGAELLYDKVLSGKTSHREVIRDASGRIIFQDKLEKEALPRDLHLTLDRDIQYFSQVAVKEMVEKTGAELGMALVQEPSSGRLLAMATWPEDLGKIQPVEWVYEPGSTFKSITLAAALEKGVVSEKDSFYCENGAWKFNNKVILHDHEPEQTLSLSGVIERSSNIGTAKVGLKLGIKDFYLYAKSFGFGSKTGLGFYGESAGILRPLEQYTSLDLAVGSYGHGMAATPVQVITAYSAIANGGELYEPRLVNRTTEFDGTEVFRNEPALVRRVISPETSRRVKTILRAVVEQGTGLSARIPGYSIAGKTGTSKKIDPRTGKYLTGKNVASFCGFFPFDQPRYTILVVMDNPKRLTYGGESAAPVFREIAARIINIKSLKADMPLPDKTKKQPPPGPVSD